MDSARNGRGLCSVLDPSTMLTQKDQMKEFFHIMIELLMMMKPRNTRDTDKNRENKPRDL